MRILTYNILDGGHGREHLILEVLQAHQPDVVFLQELFSPIIAHDLAQNLDMQYFFAEGNSRRHLALLSRLPIMESHSYHPSPAIHRAILYAKLAGPFAGPLHVFGVHLVASPFFLLEGWRLWEVKTLLQLVNPFLSEPCLIAGDFNAFSPQDEVNTTHWPRWLRRLLALQGGWLPRRTIQKMLDAGLIDCYRSLHPEEHGCTLAPPVPSARLDYIFANSVWQTHLHKCVVINESLAVMSASDHFPVLADFV
ncbi:MAG: endonuclease/exonuclease/phosphatase family protein [Anaerolineae bacterium]|nr:endonuclease/exonuclease/phosphatase family protein [Anaerolineae bacterium]